MNKEQAVSYLRFSGFSDEQIKAIEGAFSGWGSCVPVSEKAEGSEDCISRQAVLDALNNIEIPRNASWYQYYQQALTAVDKLPPAQLGTNLAEVGTDCISRQAAIDTIESWLSCDDYNEAERHIMRAMQSVLYDLPSVNPQKPICPSAGIDCEDCPAYEDAIGRKAVLNTLENMDRALDEDRTVENYKDLLRECYKVLPSVTPKPKSECEHDHEILKAYSDGASAVLESLIEQYEHYLELLDADMKDGSATIVTKTKYAVYTEVVKQLKEVEVQE